MHVIRAIDIDNHDGDVNTPLHEGKALCLSRQAHENADGNACP